MKKIIRILSLALAVMLLFASCSTPADNKTAEHQKVLFTMENGSTFIIETYPEYAPRTCENFINLVESGFYDGLTFHRIVEGFVAQGGDPKGDGTGSSDKKIIGEFAANGVQNDLSHQRGVVSMARGDDPNSASCQFFICYDDCSASLDGKYAAFGKVVDGMETVDAFLNIGRVAGEFSSEVSTPVTPIVIEKAEVIDVNSTQEAVLVTDIPTESESLADGETTTEPRLPIGNLEQLESAKVRFTMADGSSFVIETYPEYAPRTCANFLNLVESGFYNGLTFHRVVDDFVAQAGDPNGNGTGGSSETIVGEFEMNGHRNDLSHTRGVVSMARQSNDMNSASSQFFICYRDCSDSLDGKYAAFGRVIEGMEVVDSFLEVERVASDFSYEASRPVTPIVIAKAEVIE